MEICELVMTCCDGTPQWSNPFVYQLSVDAPPAEVAPSTGQAPEADTAAPLEETAPEAGLAPAIFDLLALYCPPGTELTVRVADPGDAAVLAAICELIESGFGE
mgnify:CR=1 FL=1